MKTTRTVTQSILFGAALSGAMTFAGAAGAAPKTHDGFYMQLDAGLGYLSASTEAAGITTTIQGVTTPLALLLGGTVGPVVIGGGFFGDHAASPSGSVEGRGLAASGDLSDVTMTLIGFVAFADYYVNPNEGLHFQPFVGWGGLETSSGGNSGGSDPTGLVLGLGGGYDWWVGDEWSIGVMGRVAYAPLSMSGGGASVSWPTIAPAILASFTFH